ALAACGGSDGGERRADAAGEPAAEQATAAADTASAQKAEEAPNADKADNSDMGQAGETVAEPRPEIYSQLTLETDLRHDSDNQRQMVAVLIDASDIMDELFWRQAFGDRHTLFDQIDDEATREFARINYGPWDRLAGNRPFVAGYGPKPPGANFYPADMSDAEFEALDDGRKNDLYTLIRRDEAGELTVEPYNEAFSQRLDDAAALLEQAAGLAENHSFKRYLELRADALRSNRYQPSDL